MAKQTPLEKAILADRRMAIRVLDSLGHKGAADIGRAEVAKIVKQIKARKA